MTVQKKKYIVYAREVSYYKRTVEGRYYKGWKQSEEWWRVTGDVHATDRRLWTYYHNLLNERK